MYPIKTPRIAQYIFNDVIWQADPKGNKVYLTFDDGPQKGVTDIALDLLKEHNAKASFFCVGARVEENPELFDRIKKEGHRIGNHSYSHPNGWKTGNTKYLADVEKARTAIDSELFRPPYGKLSLFQYRQLKKKYKIVMWDIIAGDFDDRYSKVDCYNNISRHIRPGSIIVLHDNIRFKDKMIYCLERLLKENSEMDFVGLDV